MSLKINIKSSWLYIKKILKFLNDERNNMLNLDENRGKKNRDKIQKVQQWSLNNEA